MNISNTSFTPANIIFAHAAEAASRAILGESLENIFVLAMRWESQCGTSRGTIRAFFIVLYVDRWTTKASAAS